MRRPTPELERVWTVRDLITWGQDYFGTKGVDSPRLTIDLLLCSVLGISRLDLYMQHDRPLTRDELAQLREYVTRRSQREPLQYILGRGDFYGLQFEVNPAVLIPRPETEILVDRCIRWIKATHTPLTRALDIGTGSGCIALAVAHHCPEPSWTCIDRSHEALDVARRNAQQLGLGERCTMQVLDILETVPPGSFDVITMNPPYIAPEEIQTLDDEVRLHEPSIALTDNADGLTFYRRFIEIAPACLGPNGRAFIELGYGQADAVSALMRKGGLETIVVDDLAGIPRVLEVFHNHITTA